MPNLSKRHGVACYFCRRRFDENIIKTKDHSVAKSRGGTNHGDNLTDCCFDCNQWKADKPLENWLDEVQAFLKRGKHRIYSKTQLGQIVGNIKSLIRELKGSKTVSKYKP